MIEGLSLNDVLLMPKFSTIKSRSEIDLSVKLPKGYSLKIPIVSANMKHVTETNMANIMGEMGGLALLHRFCSVEYAVNMFKKCVYKDYVGVSIGIKPEEEIRLKELVKVGAKIICIDVAYGFNKYVGDFLKKVSKEYPEMLWICGNVIDSIGANYLYECGADIVRVGIGNGASCATRLNTGNGIPQLTALMNSYQDNKFTIGDGGVATAGDIVKCLCYSNLVMTGSILAGTDEAPSELIESNGLKFKTYAGSSTHKNSHVEGFKGFVKYRGSAQKVIEELLQGIRSGCSYQGAHNLKELRSSPTFIKITGAGMAESRAHNMIVE